MNDKFHICIDLITPRKISSMIVSDWQDHTHVSLSFDGKIVCDYKTTETNIQETLFKGYHYDCNSERSRHVCVWWDAEKYYAGYYHISEIKVFTTLIAPPGMSLGKSTLAEISHPYSNVHPSIDESGDLIHTIKDTNFIKFEDLTSKFLDFFYGVPFMWFTVTFDSPHHIYFVVVISKHFGLPDFYLTYRTDENRKFIEHKVNNTRKIFQHNFVENQLSYLEIEEPILAKEIRVHLLSYVSILEFKINFLSTRNPYLFETLLHKVIKSVTLHPTVVSDEYEVNWIELEELHAVMSLSFDNYEMISEFCIIYKNVNNEVAYYNDQPIQSKPTIFKLESPKIYLIAFLAKSLRLSCLKLKSSTGFVIHVLGRTELEAFNWRATAFKTIGEEKQWLVVDEIGRKSLTGSIRNFHKMAPEDYLYANHYGADCLSRPQLCENGFTVKFQVKGKIESPLHDEFIIPPYDISIGSYKMRFYVAKTLKLSFRNALQYSYSEVLLCQLLTTVKVESIQVAKGKLGIYLSPVQQSSFGCDRFKKDYTFVITHGAKGSNLVVDITAQLQMELQKQQSEVRDIMLCFETENGDLVGTPKLLKMKLLTRIRVPNSIMMLQFTEGSSNTYEKFIELKKLSVVTKICFFGHIVDKLSLHFKFNDIQVTLFDREPDSVDFGLMKNVKRNCMDFLYPTILKEFFINTINIANNLDVEVFGSAVNFDTPEVFPIISSGIHGDHTNSTGQGFVIYYDNNRTLHALVKTNNKSFHASINIVEHDDENIHMYTITFNHDEVSFYIDGESISAVKTPVENVENNPAVMQEYLLIFGNYHSYFSYAHGNFKSFKLYRLVNIYFDPNFSSKSNFEVSHESVVGLHLDNDRCINIFCPTFDNIHDSVTSKYDIGKLELFEEVDGILVESFIQMTESINGAMEISFLDIHFPRHQVVFNSVFLTLNFSGHSTQMKCNVTLKNTKENSFIDSKQFGTSYKLNVTEMVANYLLSSDNKMISITFLLDEKSCIESTLTLVDAQLEIQYNTLSNDNPSLILYAHEGHPTVIPIYIEEDMRCFKVTYIFRGDGFAYVSLVKQTNNGFAKEVFRRQLNNGHWNKKSIKYPLNDGESFPYKINVVVVKNGLGRGYFKITKIEQLFKECSSVGMYQGYTDEHSKVENNIKLTGLSLPRLITLAGKTFDTYTNGLGNMVGIPTNEYDDHVIFEYGYSHYCYKDSYTFSFSDNFQSSFTFSFWFLWKPEAESYITVLFDGSPLIEVRSDGKDAIVEVNSKMFTYRIGSAINQTWLPVIISSYQAVYYLEVDGKVLTVDEVATWRFSRKQFEFQMKKSCHVYCLQYYNEVSPSLGIQKQTLLCPSRFDESVCGNNQTCGWCNFMTGKLTPHRLLNGNCDHKAVLLMQPARYFSMDSSLLIDSISGNKYEQLSQSSAMSEGVISNCVRIKEEGFADSLTTFFVCDKTCVVALWLRYSCNDKKGVNIMITDFLLIKCVNDSSENNLNMMHVVTLESCKYIQTPNNFWHHFVVTIDNNIIQHIFVDGELKKIDSCSEKFENKESVKLGFSVATRIDDFLFHKGTYTNNRIKSLFNLYILGEKNALNKIKKQMLPIWFDFTINDTHTLNSNHLIQGTKDFHELFRPLINDSMKEDFFFNLDEMFMRVNESGHRTFRLPVYARNMTDELVKKVKAIFKESLSNQPELINAKVPNDLLMKMELAYNKAEILNQSTSDTSVLFEGFHFSSVLPITGVYVNITLLTYRYDESIIVNKVYPIRYFRSVRINISDLEPYAKYQVEFNLKYTYFNIFENTLNLSKIKEVETEASVPSVAPNISCEAVSTSFFCKIFKLDEQFWHNNPYQYEIARMMTSLTYIQNYTESIFDAAEETGVEIQTSSFVSNQDYNEITFSGINEIYENFTIEVRAVTDNGKGKGVSTSITIRSQEGAPDSPPENFTVSYNNGTLYFKWEDVSIDDDYWNTNISKKETWLLKGLAYYNLHLNNDNFDIRAEYDNPLFSIKATPEMYVEIIATNVYAESNLKKTADSTPVCFVLPSDQVPFIEDEWSNSTTVRSHDVISHHINFPSFHWRGKQKYLYTVVVAKDKNVDHLAYNLLQGDILPKTNSPKDQTHRISSDVSYWIRCYRRFVFLNNNFESYSTNKTLNCSNENITQMINNGLNQDKYSLWLSRLHPFTWYNIYTRVCNENGCSKKLFNSSAKTNESIPAAPPQNVSIEPADNFAILIRWSHVVSFYANGLIKKVRIRYVVTRENVTRDFETDFSPLQHIIENIGKYEHVCFQIAAVTYDAGLYSNMSCNYTHQAAPDIAPDFLSVNSNSSSFTIQINKPNNLSLLNGILTSVIVKFNVTSNNYTNITYYLNHEEFVNPDKPFTLVLGNLEPFMNYLISLAFVTIDVGIFSDYILNKTWIGVPVSPPKDFNITFDHASANFTWTNLPDYKWNGPGVGYNITLNETLLDGSIAVKQFLVTKGKTIFQQKELHPYRQYSISIMACTRVGCSNQHVQYFRTLEAVPCPSSNISRIESTKNKLCIQWSKIDAECENGILKSYHIFVKQITKQPYVIEKSFSYNVSSSHLKSCVEDIPMGRIYNISVAGMTGAGLGLSSMEFSTVFGKIINGNWTLWTKWTPCTSSCDNGKRSRQRFCSNPTPVNGLPCQRHNNETEDCTLPRCEGVYLAPPGEFNCSKFCLSLKLRCNGYMNTYNDTTLFTNLHLHCSSLSEKLKVHNAEYHPSYDTTHQTCEGYVMRNNEFKCQTINDGSNNHVQRLCNCKDPDSEGLSEWYSWSPCLDKCNASVIKTRTRSCIVGFQCSKKAKLIDQQTCGLPPCPIDGEWSEWQESTRCSKSCDGGYKVKVRTCTNPPPDHGGEKCRGPSEDEGEVCNAHPCPVHGAWSLWTEWSSCNKPCGYANQTRERFCNNPTPKYRGQPCTSFKEMQERENQCQLQLCHELEVIVTCEILNRDWHYSMYRVESRRAVQLQTNVCKNIIKSQSNTAFIEFCQFINVRSGWKRGSVVPTVKLKYENINKYQLVSFWDQMNEFGIIDELKVSHCELNVTQVHFHPPTDISVDIINKTSVNITWKYIDKNPNALFVYVMYIEEEKKSKDEEWHVFGTTADKNNLILYYLKPEQLYRAYLVISNQLGNGVPSEKFYIHTISSPPSVYPLNVHGFAISSTTIYLAWKAIPTDFQNGLLTAYRVKYKIFSEKSFQTKIVSNDLLSCTLTDLKPYSYYHIDVSGVNLGGEGPADYSMVKTLEGVPSVPVPDVKVVDMQTIDWWSVSWSPLHKNKIHGILRGYRLKYYMSYRSDIPIGGEINWIVKDFDKFTFYHKEKNLLNYATYNLTVTGFTNAGEGPTPEHFARTCKCKEHLFAQWTIIDPYTKLKSVSSNLTGLFPDIIQKVIMKACGSCAKYHQSVLDLYSTKYGSNPMKHSDYELKLNINEDVDVSFPYYERITTQAIVPESIFLPIIKSTGCAFITRDEINLNELVIDLILNVFKVWPLLIVSYAIAALCGILIWATDQFFNPQEFTLGSSIKGPCIGFWFSFVTMTTVGYGDLTPRSIAARALSMLWFLIGLILNGIIVGFITTALTSLDQPETVKLYNTKTASLNKSFEYRYAVRRNALMTENQYLTIDEMLDDLEDKKVDAVLVDLFSMVGYKEKIKSRYLKVKAILDTQTAYGIILSGQSVHLKNDIETMIFSEQGSLSNFIQSIEEDIPTLSEEKRGDILQLVFGADSSIFQETLILLVIIFGGMFFVGCMYEIGCKIRSKMKVHAQGDETLCELEDDVERFVENITTQLDDLTSTHDKQLIELTILNYSVKRFEKKIGKEATQARINWLWKE